MFNRKLRVAELFAGAGRSIEPYRQHPQFDVALLADISTKARDAYLHNHPDSPYALIDLSVASAAQILRAAGAPIDILLGCPPCQGFSESGRRQMDDPRNDHIVKFARTIRTLRPMAFAMENVPLAAVSGQFELFQSILSGAGYEISAAVLNAAEYGSAQARQRLVVVGRRGHGSGLPVALPSPTHAPIGNYFDYVSGVVREATSADDALLGTTSSTRRACKKIVHSFYISTDKPVRTPNVLNAIGDLPKSGTAKAKALTHVGFGHGPQVMARMETVCEGGKLKTERSYHGSAYGRLHRQGLARTITRYFSNAGSGRFWHPTENRSLTVREAARLQGFGDDFHFLGGAAEANSWIIGNALDKALADASFAAVTRAI